MGNRTDLKGNDLGYLGELDLRGKIVGNSYQGEYDLRGKLIKEPKILKEGLDGSLTQWKSSRADLLLSFLNVPDDTEYIIDLDAKTIDVTVARGTVVTALVATFMTFIDITSIKIGATDQVSDVTANNFTAPKTYAIIAQDGITTGNWVVTVTVL